MTVHVRGYQEGSVPSRAVGASQNLDESYPTGAGRTESWTVREQASVWKFRTEIPVLVSPGKTLVQEPSEEWKDSTTFGPNRRPSGWSVTRDTRTHVSHERDSVSYGRVEGTPSSLGTPPEKVSDPGSYSGPPTHPKPAWTLQGLYETTSLKGLDPMIQDLSLQTITSKPLKTSNNN